MGQQPVKDVRCAHGVECLCSRCRELSEVEYHGALWHNICQRQWELIVMLQRENERLKKELNKADAIAMGF